MSVGSLESLKSGENTGTTSTSQQASVYPAPLVDSSQLENNKVHCALCLGREQKVFATRKGFGSISNVKSYSLSTSTCTLNKHLRDRHDIHELDEGSTQSSDGKQMAITKYTEGATELRPAASRYELNRDFTVWCALDLMPFDFLESVGAQFFFPQEFSAVAAAIS